MEVNKMFNSNGVSLADIAAVTGNNRNNDGMWGDGAWWIVILLIFGWGNNGWGGFGGNGNGAGYTDSAIQRGFDNQAVISKLDGISNGLCDGFYAMNNSMLTGFNGINTNIMQTGYGIQQAINADTVANMQNINALQAQLANNKKSDNAELTERVKENTRINMKLDTISSNTTEIKNEVTEMRKELNSHDNRIIKVEESVKSAHHRIDGLEARLNEDKEV